MQSSAFGNFVSIFTASDEELELNLVPKNQADDHTLNLRLLRYKAKQSNTYSAGSLLEESEEERRYDQAIIKWLTIRHKQ